MTVINDTILIEIYGDEELTKLFEQYKSISYKIQQWNPRVVYLGPAEYAEELMIGVLRIATASPESEYALDKFKVGDRVRRGDGGFSGGVIKDGKVLINPSWIVKDNDFKALEAEGRARAEADFPINVDNMERFAELVFVEWYEQDGRPVCRGWHSPNQLESDEPRTSEAVPPTGEAQ